MAEQIIAPGLLPASEKPLSALVTEHGDKVVLHLNQPREFIPFTGREAVVIGTQLLTKAVVADASIGANVVDMAMAIIDFAYEMRGDLKPAGGAVKHELIERHRATLTKRLEVVMNSTREKRTVSNHALAKELTDIMLKEVFS
jgi:hypothetical protein